MPGVDGVPGVVVGVDVGDGDKVVLLLLELLLLLALVVFFGLLLLRKSRLSLGLARPS